MMIGQLKALVAAAVFLSAKLVASAPASAPSKGPVQSPKCPSKYTVVAEDNYCKISTKAGVSVARLLAANPKISLSNVTAGQTFVIPCKPEQACCPDYLYAAPEGTGLGNILTNRPDLSLAQLLAANSKNLKVNATFTECGAEVRIPCKTGSPVCHGVGYAPATSPSKAPSKGPTRAHVLPNLPKPVTAKTPAKAKSPAKMGPAKPILHRALTKAPAKAPAAPLAIRKAMAPVEPVIG